MEAGLERFSRRLVIHGWPEIWANGSLGGYRSKRWSVGNSDDWSGRWHGSQVCEEGA